VINTQAQYPDTVVSSALWHFEPSADRAIKMVKEGKFTAEDYGQYSMMKYKGSSLAPLGTFEKKVPADVVAKMRAKEKAILDGKFTVVVNDNQPKSTAK
jgi:basic membrane lipoprotein Med (substrate-binding protein (PBP1-ABC) superfamily)